MRIKKFDIFVSFSVACLVSVRAVRDNTKSIWDDMVFNESSDGAVGGSGLNSQMGDESASIQADIRNAQILGEARQIEENKRIRE